MKLIRNAKKIIVKLYNTETLKNSKFYRVYTTIALIFVSLFLAVALIFILANNLYIATIGLSIYIIWKSHIGRAFRGKVLKNMERLKSLEGQSDAQKDKKE